MEYNELIYMGKHLSRFVVGTEGNVSRRTHNGFMIKASGKSLQNIDSNSIVHCDINGIPLNDQNCVPSMESSFHAWIYNNSGCLVIAHTHPINVLKILCTGWVDQFASNRFFPDQIVFNGARACVVPYATPGPDLANAIQRAATQFIDCYNYFPDLFLLRNHGIICCASSGREAVVMTEICEKSAEIFIGSRILGAYRYLNTQQVDSILKDDNEIYRKKVL